MLIEGLLLATLDDQRGFIREEKLMHLLLYVWFSFYRFPLWREGDKNKLLNRKRFYNRIT